MAFLYAHVLTCDVWASACWALFGKVTVPPYLRLAKGCWAGRSGFFAVHASSLRSAAAASLLHVPLKLLL